MYTLNKFLGELKIGLIDVGASGGLEPRWRSIQRNIKAFLFEPDERSNQELRSSDYVEEVFPVGLGASEIKSSLNLCRKPGVSSLLTPRCTVVSYYLIILKKDWTLDSEPY